MKILITGGSGFIGRAVLKQLGSDRHELYLFGRNRPRSMPQGVGFFPWQPEAEPPPMEAFDNADAVIHLAGEPVAQRWTDEVKQRIRTSRVVGTRNLVDALGRLYQPPKVLVCASAIGFYGDRGEETLTETSSPGNDFLAGVCQEWEEEADRANTYGVRVAKIRIGIVLGPGGGAIEKLITPFKAGVGGKIGSGRQWMSWIHLRDLAALIAYATLNDRIEGPLNGTAPHPVRNSDFTQALGEALHRPTVFSVPALALKLMYGEMAGALIGSQKVMPQAALAAGFTFEFSEVSAALRDVLK